MNKFDKKVLAFKNSPQQSSMQSDAWPSRTVSEWDRMEYRSNRRHFYLFLFLFCLFFSMCLIPL